MSRFRSLQLFSVLGLALWSCLGCASAVRHRIAILDNHDNSGSGELAIVEADGKISWTHPITGGRDLWVLPNGNVLFSTGFGAKEITPDHREVFSFTTKNEVHSCQRIDGGLTLIGECGAPRLIEMAQDGTIAHQIQLTTDTKNPHDHMRMVRKTAAGTYLVAQNGDRAICEYDRAGKRLRTLPVPVQVHAIVALPNGNLLISGNNGPDGGPALSELDATGKEVWHVGKDDLPGIHFSWMSGVQRLPNGNTVLVQWLGHKQAGKGPHMVEITPDKQVVWTFADHANFKTVSAVQVLDVPGEPLR